MKDLGGNSFDLNDFLKKNESQDLTASEKISNLLEGLNDIVIKEKQVDVVVPNDEMDKLDSDNGADSFVDTMELSGEANQESYNIFDVSINDDDVYYPLKDEKKPTTMITSDNVEEPIIFVEPDSVEENKEFRMLNSTNIINLNTMDSTNDNSQEQQSLKRDNKTDPFKRFADTHTNINSDDLFSALGLSDSARSVVVKDNHRHRNKPTSSGEVNLSNNSVTDTSTGKKKDSLKLKSQDARNIVDESEEFNKISEVSVDKRNIQKINELFDEIENKKDDDTSEIKLNSQSIRTEGLMNSLDSILTDISTEKSISASSIAKSLMTNLDEEVKTTGKRFIKVDPDTITTEVRNILMNRKGESEYPVEILYPNMQSTSNRHTIIAYKDIPKQFNHSRKKVLNQVLQKLKDTLIRTNKSCKIVKSKSLRVPAIFDYSDSGISSLTESELKLVENTIKSGYLYDVQDNKILIWGVK